MDLCCFPSKCQKPLDALNSNSNSILQRRTHGFRNRPKHPFIVHSHSWKEPVNRKSISALPTDPVSLVASQCEHQNDREHRFHDREDGFLDLKEVCRCFLKRSRLLSLLERFQVVLLCPKHHKSTFSIIKKSRTTRDRMYRSIADHS